MPTPQTVTETLDYLSFSLSFSFNITDHLDGNDFEDFNLDFMIIY